MWRCLTLGSTLIFCVLSFFACADEDPSGKGGAAKTAPPKTATPKTAPKAPSAPKAEKKYVQASTLTVRAEPKKGAKKVDAIAINTEVTPLGETKGDYLHVKLPSGKTGWVAAALVDTSPVTIERANEVISLTSGEERVSWLERAAALDPLNPAHLDALMAEHERMTNVAGVKATIQKLSALDMKKARVHLVDAVGAMEFGPKLSTGEGSLIASTLEKNAEGHYKPRAIPKKWWSVYGINPQAQWWLLPTSGPAIRTKPLRVEVVEISFCGQFGSMMAAFEMPKHGENLDESGEAIQYVAVSQGSPPKTWKAKDIQRKVSREEALKLVTKETVMKRGKIVEEFGVEVRPTPLGWVGWFSEVLEEEMRRLHLIRVKQSGLVERIFTKDLDLEGSNVQPLTEREIDGAIEVVMDSGCDRETLVGGKSTRKTQWGCCM